MLIEKCTVVNLLFLINLSNKSLPVNSESYTSK